LDGRREVGESAAPPLFREFPTPGGIVRVLTPAAINSKVVISPAKEISKSHYDQYLKILFPSFFQQFLK
jgi:hypothetical protein